MKPQDSDSGSKAVPPRAQEVRLEDANDTTCPHCGESRDLAKVKGCIKCLVCGFKFDCNGW